MSTDVYVYTFIHIIHAKIQLIDLASATDYVVFVELLK